MTTTNTSIFCALLCALGVLFGGCGGGEFPSASLVGADDDDSAHPGDDDDVTPDDDDSGDDDSSTDDDGDDDDDSTEPPPLDADGDGWRNDVDCDDNNPDVHPTADEGCDYLDTDCDGFLGVNEIDFDGDGVDVCYGDCDDTDARTFPGQTEFFATPTNNPLYESRAFDFNCDSSTTKRWATNSSYPAVVTCLYGDPYNPDVHWTYGWVQGGAGWSMPWCGEINDYYAIDPSMVQCMFAGAFFPAQVQVCR